MLQPSLGNLEKLNISTGHSGKLMVSPLVSSQSGTTTLLMENKRKWIWEIIAKDTDK